MNVIVIERYNLAEVIPNNHNLILTIRFVSHCYMYVNSVVTGTTKKVIHGSMLAVFGSILARLGSHHN